MITLVMLLVYSLVGLIGFAGCLQTCKVCFSRAERRAAERRDAAILTDYEEERARQEAMVRRARACRHFETVQAMMREIHNPANHSGAIEIPADIVEAPDPLATSCGLCEYCLEQGMRGGHNDIPENLRFVPRPRTPPPPGYDLLLAEASPPPDYESALIMAMGSKGEAEQVFVMEEKET